MVFAYGYEEIGTDFEDVVGWCSVFGGYVVDRFGLGYVVVVWCDEFVVW